jgi:hypothetical protein
VVPLVTAEWRKDFRFLKRGSPFIVGYGAHPRLASKGAAKRSKAIKIGKRRANLRRLSP